MAKLTEPVRVVPNLVPMIDIVSQLVIFFMLATQFVSADVDVQVQLPVLTDSQAKTDKSQTPRLFVNIRCDPNDPTKPGDILAGMVNVTDEAKKANKDWMDALHTVIHDYDKRCDERHVPANVVLRADRRLQWQVLLQVQSVIAKYDAEKRDAKNGGTMNTPIVDISLVGPIDPRGTGE